MKFIAKVLPLAMAAALFTSCGSTTTYVYEVKPTPKPTPKKTYRPAPRPANKYPVSVGGNSAEGFRAVEKPASYTY